MTSAMEALTSDGYTAVSELEGGYRAWDLEYRPDGRKREKGNWADRTSGDTPGLICFIVGSTFLSACTHRPMVPIRHVNRDKGIGDGPLSNLKTGVSCSFSPAYRNCNLFFY